MQIIAYNTLYEEAHKNNIMYVCSYFPENLVYLQNIG